METNLAALRRFRQPAAVIILVLIVANMAMSIWAMLRRMPNMSLLETMRFEAGATMSLVYIIMALLVIGSCILWEPATKHASALAWTAGFLVVLGTLIALANMVAGLMLSRGVLAFFEFVGGFTDVVIKAIAAFIFLYLARRMRRTGTGSAAPVQRETIDPVTPPEQASGARWGSAAAAASGAQAQWGGQAAAGWNPRAAHQPAAVGPAPEQAPPPAPEPVPEATTIHAGALDGPPAKASRDLWG